jgi:glycosyltransferase involved in cell wall biosynthesis
MLRKIRNFEVYQNNRKIIFKKKIPTISVITVVLNAEKFLEKTLLNIFRQSYSNLEIIVVYTPSSDDTWKIIQKYKHKIQKIIINYQTGVYNAFNSGVLNASGQWINFMNAGDFFYSRTVISKVFQKKENINKEDVIYGDVVIQYKNFQRTIKSLKIRNIIKKMCFSHQSCFIKTELQKKNLFKQSNFKYASDYNLFFKLYEEGKKFAKKNFIISVCKSDGIADTNRYSTLMENIKIKNFYSSYKFILYDYFIILIFFSRNLIIRMIGRNNYLILLKLFYNFFK